MMDAIMGGHVPVAMILRKAGGRFADPGAAGTQLCEAAMDGNVRQLKLLVDCGVGLNQASRCLVHSRPLNGKERFGRTGRPQRSSQRFGAFAGHL